MAKKFALSLKVMNFLFVLSVAYMQEQSDSIETVAENRAGSKFDAEILQYHLKTEIILVEKGILDLLASKDHLE